PGNAIKVRTREKLPLHQWLQLGITYDGSSRAPGITLYVNGKPAELEVVKDQLFKDFANGVPLTLAARFRGRGFKNGLIDELKVFNRCLTPIEMADAFNGIAVKAAVRLARMTENTPPPRPLPSGSSKFKVQSSKFDVDRAGVRSSAHDELFDYFLARLDAGYTRQLTDLKKLRDQENEFINRIEEIMVMGDLPSSRPTHVLKRGAYDAPGEVVEAGTPESIMPLDPKLPRNRLGLARWLIDPKNPLTARVVVNRYWQMFFGRGIVVTAEDFGSQGQWPTHPELLDWLAKHFMAADWDLKALHKLIVMSATYRQSSPAGPELLARDPDNKLLARGPKNRLTAEMLRDGALAAADLLAGKVGGPSVKPYQPEGLWEEKSAGWKYETDKGEGLYRRSLYTFWKRTSQHPMMIAFDAAERNTCVVRRQSASTPLQALVLLNDPQFVEAARKVGERILKEGGATVDDRVAYAFRLLTSRKPTAREAQVLKRLYQEQLNLFREDQIGADELDKLGASARDPALDRIELAASTALANTLLNYDDVVMKR
ncbi:MAG: hypothetical protein DME26_08725, partial [Verrucomicrobia bacterium]